MSPTDGPGADGPGAGIQAALALAMERQRAGRLAEAADGYRAVLALHPQHPAALALLAIVERRPAERTPAQRTVQPPVEAAPRLSGAPAEWLAEGRRLALAGDYPQAIERFRAAVQAQAESAEALVDLAAAILVLIRRDDEETFRALDRDRTSLPAMNAIGHNLARHRRLWDEGLAALDRALVARPGWGLAHFLRGEFQTVANNIPAATAAFAQASEAGHHEARFRLATLGGAKVETSPPTMVAALFDEYAPHFDAEMDELACHVPKDLIQALSAAAGDAARFDLTVDLGCGTGRCGALIRERTKRLIGIDLSSQMLARAEQRGIYDALYAEELITGLAHGQDCDLVLAGEVVIYVGRLEAPFAALAAVMRPGGWLAISTEKLAQGEVQLLPTGRFAHSPEYIERLAASQGFEVALVRDIVVRLDLARQPIAGQVFVLRRTGLLPLTR